MAVHPVQPRGDPPAAGLQEPEPQPRETLTHAGHDETRARGHHLERVGDGVTRRGAVEPVEPKGRDAHTRSLVQADGEVELLRLCPDGVIGGVVDGAAMAGIGAKKTGAHS